MNAPSQKNDGMGSRLYSDNTSRFRLWAPFASDVQVILDHPLPDTTYALANEPGTPNWSADGIPAAANTRYQYLITTAAGPDNDTSQAHLRTDARALQVESSDPAPRATSSIPPSLPPTASRSRPRPSRISSSTSSTLAPSPDATMVSTGPFPPPPLLNSRIASVIYGIWASTRSSSFPFRTSRLTRREELAKDMDHPTCSPLKTCTPPPPTRR